VADGTRSEMFEYSNVCYGTFSTVRLYHALKIIVQLGKSLKGCYQ